MPQTYFTVGPSQIYPTYMQHLQTAMDLHLGSIGHRTSTFRKIYQHTTEQLRILLNIPASHAIFFTPSATEIWERILLNTVKCNSFHLVNGAFSQRFYEYAIALQKTPKLYNVNHGEGFDFSSIIIPEENELICTTQNETASGVQIPVSDLVELKKNTLHNYYVRILYLLRQYRISITTISTPLFLRAKSLWHATRLRCLDSERSLFTKGQRTGSKRHEYWCTSYLKQLLQKLPSI